MNNLLLIARLRLDQQWNISRIKYEKDKRKKILYWLHTIFRILIVVIAVAFIYSCTEVFARQGYVDVLPVLSYVTGSVFGMVIMIVQINEQLSGKSDVEFLLSLPVSNMIQILFLFLQLYIETLYYVMLCSVPMGIVYGQNTGAGVAFWIRWVVGILLTGLLVSGIASLLGIVISLVLSALKNRNLIQSCISLGAISVVFALVLHVVYLIGRILSTQGGMEAKEISERIIAVISQNYRFGRLYQLGVVEGNVAWFALFILISAIWSLFFLFFLSIGYQEFMLALKAPVSYRKYKWKNLKERPLKKTIFFREADLWMRSKTYMIHSLTGAAAAVIFSGWVCFHGKDKLCELFGISGMELRSLWCMLAFLCAGIGMCCTTYCSLSIEGRRYWIWATTPVEASVLFGAKIRLNLCITLPLAFICGGLLGMAFQVKVWQGLLCILVPGLYAVLGAHWGMFIEKKYADFTQESESQVLSQSISFFLGKVPQVIIPTLAGAAIVFGGMV